MRTVRYSKTFLGQFEILLAQGYERFGLRVVTDKRDRVLERIEKHLARFPASAVVDVELGLRAIHVSKTPGIAWLFRVRS
ncbi:MAG: hypothetical protein ACT4N2_11650 [Hyphomicrobium sp.]